MKQISLVILILSIILPGCSQQLSTEEYIKKGQQFINEKKWSGAVIEFKNAVQQAPENSPARVLLGQAYVKVGSNESAVKEFNKAILLGADKSKFIEDLLHAYEGLNRGQKILDEIKPDKEYTNQVNAVIHAARAKAYLIKNDLDKAKQELVKASKIDNDATEVRLSWALFERKSGRNNEVRKWLAPLLERNGGVAGAWSIIGDIEQREGNLKQAESAYSRSIKIRNSLSYDNIKRVLLRIDLKDFSGAQSDIEALKKAKIKSPIISHAEGLLAFNKRDFDKALSSFKSALSQNPQYHPSELWMAMTQLARGEILSAQSYIQKYLAADSTSYRANFIYASILMKQGQIKSAIHILEKLNKEQPENYEVTSMLGGAFIQAKQPEKGLALIKKAVSLKPDLASARLQLGGAYASLSDANKAQVEFSKAIELDPELKKAYLALFNSYVQNKQFAKARSTAKKLIDNDSKNSLGSNLLALSFLAENDKDQAIKMLRKTLSKFPGDALTTNNLSRFYVQNKQFSEAIKVNLETLKINSGSLNAINQLALIAAKEGNTADVEKWLKKAVASHPESLSSRLRLASYYLGLKQPSEAIQVLLESGEQDKQETGYLLLLSKAKIDAKEYQQAIRTLKILVSKNSSLVSAYFLLAQAYGGLNDADNVRKNLDKILDIDPRNLKANLILSRLDLNEGKIESFKKRITSLFKLYPDSREVQFLRAKIDASEKSNGKAIKTLSSLLAESPNSEVVLDLSKNYWQVGDKENAISTLDLWVDKHPEDSAALFLLAQFLLSDNRSTDALDTYKKLEKLVPENAIVLNNIASLLMPDDVKSGLSYAEKALSLKPENPYIMDTMAMLLFKNGELERALQLSGKASKLDKKALDVQINYATILSANGKKAEAKKLLNDLLARARAPQAKHKIKNAIRAL